MKLSISSYNNYRACNRRYYIEKVLGYRDISSKPWLLFGQNFDKLMEYSDLLGVDLALKQAESLFKNGYELANAEYLLLKYGKKYEDNYLPTIQGGNQYEINLDLSQWVEDKFELIFTGFIDKVYSIKDGGIGIVERKTTSDTINETSLYWQRLLFDPQIVGYSYGLGVMLDISVNNVVYEVFRKPNPNIDAKLFKKDTDPQIYRDRLLNSLETPVARDAEMVNRKIVTITDEMRENWLYEFVAVAEEIHAKSLLCYTLENPEYEWARNKDTCDKFIPCAFKDFCGCRSDLIELNNVRKK